MTMNGRDILGSFHIEKRFSIVARSVLDEVAIGRHVSWVASNTPTAEALELVSDGRRQAIGTYRMGLLYAVPYADNASGLTDEPVRTSSPPESRRAPELPTPNAASPDSAVVPSSSGSWSSPVTVTGLFVALIAAMIVAAGLLRVRRRTDGQH